MVFIATLITLPEHNTPYASGQDQEPYAEGDIASVNPHCQQRTRAYQGLDYRGQKAPYQRQRAEDQDALTEDRHQSRPRQGVDASRSHLQQGRQCCKHSYFLYDISCIKINDDTQKD